VWFDRGADIGDRLDHHVRLLVVDVVAGVGHDDLPAARGRGGEPGVDRGEAGPEPRGQTGGGAQDGELTRGMPDVSGYNALVMRTIRTGTFAASLAYGVDPHAT